MSLHTIIKNPGIYFLTFTCCKWLPLIELTNLYDKIYSWFNILEKKGNAVNGYVIMPNHVHLLLYYAGLSPPLNTVIGNGKRFLAYDVVKSLKFQGQTELLTGLEHAVNKTAKAGGKKHNVWKDSFDSKSCRTEKFIMQKLNYMHNNPCMGKWKLADDPLGYFHSSASFYGGQKNRGIVKHYRNYIM